jgi:hypothetical protein
MTVRDLSRVLGDPSLTWTQRRTRLQGWRGHEAECADAAVGAQRIGPAVCAAGALAGAALQSPILLLAFAITAVMGALAPNHPVEWLYNLSAGPRGRPTLPANRAAKRLGCAIGVIFLGGAAAAYALGATTLGLVLALTLAGTASFVAITGICLPSMIFTVLWGSERGACPRLVGGDRLDNRVGTP